MWKKWSDWTTAFMVVTRNIMLHLRVGFFEDWMYERIPILLCVFTKRSMNHQCNMDSVRLLTMAQGSSRGSVTHRPTMGPSGGFCSYNGERRSHVLKRNSPLEGPGEHHLYLFNNAKQNPLFMVFYQHFMNLLLNSSSYFTRFFFKMYHMNGIFKHSASWIYTLALLTFNFYNCSHVDMYDCHPELVDPIKEKLDEVMDCEAMPMRLKKQAAFASAFVEETDAATPTTCCYQLIDDRPNKTGKLECHYYFAMDGMNSCVQIFDKMTLSFCGSVFQHNTSVPLWIEDNCNGTKTVYVGDHPHCTFLAWGGGKNKNGSRRTSRRGRRPKRARG